jgi:hypothetical protein
MGDRDFVRVASGPRMDILALERMLVMAHRGPQNREAWAGTIPGAPPPAAMIAGLAAAGPCVTVF